MTIGFEPFLPTSGVVLITGLKGGLSLDGLFTFGGNFYVAPSN